ncbi:MAG: pantetheine-phosphate adenylyltransferase [Clostridiales bacterium]|nr:pantetheine-phosphate adenylyltransferase [Clostridiales bacterium]
MRVVCPGSFNPVTRGHLDIFERCAALFDEVVVVVVHNPLKAYSVPAERRAAWIRRATAHLHNLSVSHHGGLLADFVRAAGASAIVKGLRNQNDLLGEAQMYFANRELLGGLDTLFLPTREPFVYLSSSLVRDIASHGGDIAPFVPDGVAQEVAQAYRMAAPPSTVTGIEKNDPINKGETT